MHLAADHTPSAQAGPDSELAALLAYTTVLGFLPAPPHCLSSQRPGWHRGQDGLSCWPVRPRILFKTISIAPRREPLPHKVLFEPIPYSFWTFSLTAPAQHISETLVKYCKLVLPQCVCWRLFLLYRMFCSWDLGLTSSAVSMKRPWDHLRVDDSRDAFSLFPWLFLYNICPPVFSVLISWADCFWFSSSARQTMYF